MNGQKTTYLLQGDTMIQERRANGDVIGYAHDATGKPVGFEYYDNAAGTMTYCYYRHNLQGDITDLCDRRGNSLVHYTYDAWGKLISITGEKASTLGVINPLRYRGYYYDSETGLYYLQSRYYDPEVGRFISADGILSMDTMLGTNLFAYCENNPICFLDENGKLKKWTLNGKTYSYDGSVADFHRLENGLPPIAYTRAMDREKALMAATVYAESAAYSEQSKKAVANVVKNRVGTKKVNGQGTRNSILDVVSEPAQFSSYGNKWYDEAMTYYETGVVNNAYNKRVLKQCMRIVLPIYDGTEADITDGCTYFYSPVSMNPPGRVPGWVSGKTEVRINGVNPSYFRFYK